ncbi:MAG TPA: SEC-C domain-containing protein [Solirubrobacteraceae bacterium]|jgi:hypothetical protein|nr:SEC-C domain-containing protein [Solirubrobacteraceae bacterium]
MPSRNDRCPCGSSNKFKRCCLPRMDAVAGELRDRDALLAKLIDWVKDEHEQTVEDASRETTLVRMLRGRTGRSMSSAWALCDFTPADGGPPLMSRFVASAGLDSGEREIARGLVEARLDAYRVACGAAGATIELVSLTDGAHVHVFAGDGFQLLDVGDTLVARIVRDTSIASVWGLCARFDGEHDRRWRARIATLPSDRAQAALVLLHFHPDDVAEPLPDHRDLHSVTWRVDDDDEILEALEEDGELECLGEHIPSGWAFAWLDDPDCGHLDLGGWVDGEEIEIARLIVRERELTVVSADDDVLGSLVAHVERSMGELIASPPLRRAA